MQQTLILFKPDSIKGKFVGKVLDRIEGAGFTIRACKMIRLTPAQLREHYAHIAAKPFYPEIEAFMSSTPVIAMVLEGENIIEKLREMLGVTDSRKAADGTIRKAFGTDQMVNVLHASDGPESAVKEIARFFRPEELYSY